MGGLANFRVYLKRARREKCERGTLRLILVEFREEQEQQAGTANYRT